MANTTISTCLSTRNPILFGRGVSQRVGAELQHLGVTKALVVFDKGVQAAGIVDKITKSIADAGIGIVLYDNVQPDPPDWSCEEAAQLGRAEGVNGVVAVGGGSSLDTGKGAKVLLTNPPPMSRYYLEHEDVVPDESKMYPIIVIPTTAGTGSEATPGGVITDTKENKKRNVPCMSNLGIVDPELTACLPPLVTATTAVDALCHAAEAYTSNKPNAISDLFNEKAIGLIGAFLPRVFDDPADIEAREGVQLAATLGGLGLMGPFCHIPHEIGLIIGMKFHIPHGTACGMTLPEALEYIAPELPERVRTVAELLGAEIPANAGPEEIGKLASACARRLYEKIGFPKLSQYATKDDVLAAVPQIMDPYPFIHSPRELTADAVAKILETAYDR
ncbi:MAG: iron-containing alcohol dehydrogenase [Clostridiales Family XIII bacterium]|jgi:alcohol dehydrogenase class IV|nr:iron-containing alcohol dehydrogenase [Clostridiales Family XIII bacterium]